MTVGRNLVDNDRTPGSCKIEQDQTIKCISGKLDKRIFELDVLMSIHCGAAKARLTSKVNIQFVRVEF